MVRRQRPPRATPAADRGRTCTPSPSSLAASAAFTSLYCSRVPLSAPSSMAPGGVRAVNERGAAYARAVAARGAGAAPIALGARLDLCSQLLERLRRTPPQWGCAAGHWEARRTIWAVNASSSRCTRWYVGVRASGICRGLRGVPSAAPRRWVARGERAPQAHGASSAAAVQPFPPGPRPSTQPGCLSSLRAQVFRGAALVVWGGHSCLQRRAVRAAGGGERRAAASRAPSKTRLTARKGVWGTDDRG